jgi:hypothetical protein
MRWSTDQSEVDGSSPDPASWRIAKALVLLVINLTAGIAGPDVPAVFAEVLHRLKPMPVPMLEHEIINQVWGIVIDVVADRAR